MKIQFISDLHCETHSDGGLRMLDELPVVSDVLVVAGDLAPHSHLVQSVDMLCNKFPHVVHVPGNHEYYFSDRGEVNNDLVKLQRRFSNFHSINCGTVEIGGQRFVGATGWFPDSPTNWAYENMLNDFRMVKGFKKWVYQVHKEHRQFLLDNVRPDDVVVTHHAPTELSIHPKYAGNQYNRFYVANFQDVIEQCKPKLWIHGHMHNRFDYEYGPTRVVCNPMGIRYLGENDCLPSKVIDLSAKDSFV